MSRFNVLLHGEAGDVADELADQPCDEQELRVALQNAFIKIERLEKLVANLRKELVE